MSVKASSIIINNDGDDDTLSTSKVDLIPIHANKRRSNVEESDEEQFMVPDVEDQRVTTTSTSTGTTKSDHPTNSDVAASDHNNNNNQPEKRRRGRNPVDKEYRRLKRLLRNRVSAQQARERKKVYVTDLESRAQELHHINANLEEKISTVINENTMLRKVLMNTRPKVDEGTEFKQDITAKS